jgi:hypothetical protein
MNSRVAITLLTTALTLGAPGLASAAEPASSQNPLPTSKTALSERLAQGDLEKRLTEALEATPSPEQLLGLKQALASMASTSPAEAATASQAVVNSAWTTAARHPQVGVEVATIAVTVLSNPSIAAAAPEITGQALADVHGVITLAQRAAESHGITLAGTEIAEQARGFATNNASINSTIADFDALVTDAIELAEAQAELTDFATAAPPFGGFGFPPGFFDRPRPVASPAAPPFSFSF